MKLKKILCTLLCALLLANAAPAAQAAGLRASIATDAVTLNGQEIDNATAQYPLLVYKDITYFPMTYDLCRFLGLATDWDNGSRALTITRTGENGDYVADTGHRRKTGSVTVTRVDYPVVVGDETVDNRSAQWPLINYSGVTYFPLTWAFAVDAFSWDYHWDEASGLRIDSSGGGVPVSTGTWSDGEAMNAASRGWATAAWSSSPENLTVDLEDDWTLEGIKKAIGGGLEAHMKGTRLEGRLTEVTILYSFQFPASLKAGDVLKVPYQASYHGDPVVLPSGNTFTPGSTSEEATASVRLTGQGAPVLSDSSFQAGQEMYRKLEACTKLETVELAAGTDADVWELIHTAIESKLTAAGLAEQCYIQSCGLGSYKQPGSMAAGESEDISFQVTFSPGPSGTQVFSISGQITVKIR